MINSHISGSVKVRVDSHLQISGFPVLPYVNRSIRLVLEQIDTGSLCDSFVYPYSLLSSHPLTLSPLASSHGNPIVLIKRTATTINLTFCVIDPIRRDINDLSIRVDMCLDV